MFLLHNLLHFGRLLHELGIDVHAGRMLDVAEALDHIDISRRSDFRATLRSLLIHRHQDLAIFDDAFRVFWRRPPAEWSARDLRAMGERRRHGPPQVEIPARAAEPGDAGQARERVERVAPESAGASAVSRTKNFAELTDEEIRRAAEVVAAITWSPGHRLTRRWVGGPGRALDLRRIVGRNLRYGGDPVELPRRARLARTRPLVLLCDVSGSMERYARMLLAFTHTLAGEWQRVEVFVFATRLTRLTHDLQRVAAAGMAGLPGRVADWGGGTTIGAALRTFNVQWARRVLTRDPVVLLISDGWDRGEPDLLRREISRIQRSCRRLIWLNPLLGSPEYRPLARGMQAALPFVDDFLPVHNLASLESLAGRLNDLPAGRPPRGRRAPRPA